MDKYLKKLDTICDASIDRYQYYLARYFNDITIDLHSEWEFNPYTAWASGGFDLKQDSDLYKSAYINVIKSAIDTLVSKLANQKVRPFFTPVNGLHETKQVVKNVQQYFDVLFDKSNIHAIVSSAFRNACIFGIGYVYVNPINYVIRDIPPHCIALLDSECKYGTPTKMLVKYLNYPVDMVKDYCGKEADTTSNQYCTLRHYINCKEHTQEVYVNNKKVYSGKYDADILPVIPVYYNKPVFGTQTTSIVQELDGIQTQIDLINAKVSAASQLSSGNVTYVIEGSNLTPADIDNRVGHVYGVKMPPGTNTPPVVNIAPAPFDSQWQTWLQYLIKQAFEIIGISELSSSSQKPSGLDSGTALKTMEDIESDRFETQTTHYVNSYVDLAKLLIEMLPEDADILPQSMNTSSLKWKDIKKQTELFKVQYSAASSLSKDPQEKQKQVMQMMQTGLITADKVSKYLDMPDLEDAYASAGAVAAGVEQCIERAIKYEEYDIPDFVNYQNLAQQIAIVENELYAAISDDKDGNEEVETSLERLMILEENLARILEEKGFVDLTEQNSNTENTEAPEAGEGGIQGVTGTNQAADITSTIDNATVNSNADADNQLANENSPEQTGLQ